MGTHINNFNFNKMDLHLSNSEFWDYFVNTDEDFGVGNCSVSDDCVTAQFDFNNPLLYDGSDIKKITSLKSWEKGMNNGISIPTYGLTGLDNGVLSFVKDINDPTNENLENVLLESTLDIPNGEVKLFLNQVSGSTDNNISYPVELFRSQSGNNDYMNFMGGFYQGFYKLDGYDYEVLPNRVNKGFMLEFWLNKDDDLKSEDTILNDIYPENKGIFMYLGTRAENKFWNQFEGNNIDDASECTLNPTDLCTPIKEADVLIENADGMPIPLNPPLIKFTKINNEFLLYGRSRGKRRNCGPNNSNGKNNGNIDDIEHKLGKLMAHQVSGATPTIIVKTKMQTTISTLNPFLIFGRSRGGNNCGRPSDGFGRETTCSFEGQTVDQTELDKDLDIVDNALAFIIKDNGSIGYRLLTKTCINGVTGTTVTEKFSAEGIIREKEWTHVSIRWVTNYYDDCELINGVQRTGRLMFYIGCQLKFVDNNFPEFIARRLEDYREKQVGVPFNISIGGGTQGLFESMTFDGPDQLDKDLIIEKTFAGSFIGSIYKFKMYNCNTNWCEIKSLCRNMSIGE